MVAALSRKRPVGAEIVEGGVHFRVWAPHRQTVHVVLVREGQSPRIEVLSREDDGYHAGLVPGIDAGQRYFLRVDGDPRDYPDPASCFQPDGVHGPSEVVGGDGFSWSDASWPGVSLAGQIIYELHVGTWTPEGTWKAATDKLPHLAGLGVTLVEVMPVAEFPGRFGWGYDGVYWYAPTPLYGRPDDFRWFVDRAHRIGLGVLLDVV